MNAVQGIHHVTAIAGDPQENLNFYQGVLGMRLVKRSINQDSPDTFHLFFGDAVGSPGTDLTFFPWPHLGTGSQGAGSWDEVSLTVPDGSLVYWQERFARFGVDADAIETRFDERVLPFRDWHGTLLNLTEAPLYDGFSPVVWEDSVVPADKQVRGLGGMRLMVRDVAASGRFLSGSFGFYRAVRENGWQRFNLGAGASGQRIDMYADPTLPRGRWGTGSVHHVAFRAADTSHEALLRQSILQSGGNPTGVIDRFWFESVYVREPGGALCEIATDGPGFSVDEDPAHLGERLVLPHWYEQQRAQIESGLVQLADIERSRYI